MKMSKFFITHEELFNGDKKRIAIVTDGLTPEETKNAMNFINDLKKKGLIKGIGFRNVKPKNMPKDYAPFSIGFNLHECLLQYPQGDRDKKTEEEMMDMGNGVEFVRLLPVDEVWYFDKGESTLPIDGRLFNRIKDMEKPIRFLCRNEDNTSWDFYRSVEFIWNVETEEIEEIYKFIGELETINNNDDIAPVSDKMRSISKDDLSEKEYAAVTRALILNTKLEARHMVSMIRLDVKERESIEKYINEVGSIILKITCSKELLDEDIRNIETQLDFIEAELED